MLTNMGAIYRRLNDYENGVATLQKVLETEPDEIDALINLGGMYVNEGNPAPGIVHLERAQRLLKEAGREPRANWNLGLLRLESGDYGAGFDLYHDGVLAERIERTYPGNPVLYQPHMPREGKKLIVWGEQGIGDELMFGTILEDARREFGEVIFDCHPRLEWLHRQAHPGMQIFPTRKESDTPWAQAIAADYKTPIGDLARLYRRTRQGFIDAWLYRFPFYDCDHAERDLYRERLREIAGKRRIVGLATRGGTLTTARVYRSLRPPDVMKLVQNTDALYVVLDYEDSSKLCENVNEACGELRMVTVPSITLAYDYHHHGALAAACDMVVTVCQSIAHLAAGMGLITRVLTPKRVAWRYGLESEEWYWYPSPKVRLLRQENAESWEAPLERAIAEVRGL
jgi:tetratricopeptide (TPR) repeat protein